jgi:hypothetical protein
MMKPLFLSRPKESLSALSSTKNKEAENVHHHSGRRRRSMRLCRFSRRRLSIPGLTRPLSIGAEIADMKKPTLRIEEQQPRNIQRADIAPSNGYAMVVDGHFKTHFSEESAAKKAASELLASFPMLKIEIYDATARSRTLMK